MPNTVTQQKLSMVGSNCSQFTPISMMQATMSAREHTVSCSICRNWTGEKCTVNAFDNVLANIEYR